MKKITSFYFLKHLKIKSSTLFLMFSLFFFLNNLNAQTYCTPQYNDGCDDGDDLNSIIITGHGSSVLSDLNTGCAAVGAYENRTTIVNAVDLMQGQTYSVQLNTTYLFGSSEYAYIWIDFNNDGTFATSEKVLNSFPLASSPSFATTSITIPLTATTGLRRMRVRVVYDPWLGTPGPCTTEDFGETHDYNVNILALPACTGVPVGGSVSLQNQIICNGSTPAAISVSNANPGVGGFTYQWEESDDNGVADAWANTVGGSGATTLSYTPPSFAGTTNKYYRLKTTCTASSQSAYSSVHTVYMAMAPNPATALTFTDITTSSMTIGWTKANGNRRLVKISPVNTFTPMSNGSGAAHTASSAFSGTGEKIVYDGTGSSVTVTGLTCNTIYYVQVYEYQRCGSSPTYNYWYGTVLQGNQTSGVYFQTPISLPSTTNFTGFTGSNLTTVFPGWTEAIGDGPLSGTSSAWSNSSALGTTTAKLNLYSNTKKEWILSPTLTVNAFSRVKLKAAITDWNNSNVDSDRMQGTDDKVEVMISTDICGVTWTPIYTFNAATTLNLTNVLTDYTITIPPQYIGQNVRIGFKASEGTVDDAADYDFHVTNIVIENTPPPTVTATKTDNVCFGGTTGTASAVPAEGTPPYTYSWSPSGGTGFKATGLAAGTYTVTVTDANNLTASATVTVTEPSIIVPNTISTNATCNSSNNGTATATPTGGTAPYTYLWSNNATTNSISNLTPGTYSVTVTDINGCKATESITIVEPTVLSATNAAQTDVSWYGGNDGSATVSVTGGTAPYTYLWNTNETTPTISNLVAGTYTVTVTDANGCTTTLSFVINQPIPLMVQSTSQTDVSCNGGSNGSATIVAMGGNAPYTYLWSPTGGTNPNATGLAAGTYTVLVTDSTGNTITEPFTILEPDSMVASISQSTNINCNGGSNGSATVSVSGGTAPYTYFWSNGMTSDTATNLVAGTYSVNITDNKGCTTSQTVTITQPVALVVTKATTTNISCFGQNDGSATVLVSGGVAPYTYTWSNGQTGTSITNLGKGNYTVTVTDTNGCTTTQVFTIIEPAFVHPPVIPSQGFCSSQNAKLSDITITGSNIKWFTSATGGSLLAASTPIVNGTTYYASQTVNGCESSTRTAILISIYQATPLTTSQLNVCGNTIIQDVTIQGLNHLQLKWYTSATAATPLSSSYLLTSGTYYISTFTNNTCESTRQAVQVTVSATVPVPIVTQQNLCGSGIVSDLKITPAPGATLNWYTSMQSTVPLATNASVLSGTYYVEQVIGSCKSVRVSVPVQIVSTMSPQLTSITTCDGTTIADFNNTSLPNKYVWYVNNTTTTALSDTFVIASGTYFIAQEVSGCISQRTSVTVNVNPRPVSPTGMTTQSFSFAAKVSNLQMNQPNVAWFTTYNDALLQTNELTPNTLLIDAQTYYGITRGTNSCGSYPTAVNVVINVSTTEMDLAHLKYYPNPVDSELNITYVETIKKIEVFTITGQRTISKDFDSKDVKLDLSNLSSGTYVVRIVTENAAQFVKVVKK